MTGIKYITPPKDLNIGGDATIDRRESAAQHRRLSRQPGGHDIAGGPGGALRVRMMSLVGTTAPRCKSRRQIAGGVKNIDVSKSPNSVMNTQRMH